MKRNLLMIMSYEYYFILLDRKIVRSICDFFIEKWLFFKNNTVYVKEIFWIIITIVEINNLRRTILLIIIVIIIVGVTKCILEVIADMVETAV